MQLKTETDRGVTVIAPPADALDAHNAGEFKKAVAPLLEKSRRVVLDLRHIAFIDSSGCGALVSCLRRLTAGGGDLKLSGVSGPVRTLLELVRMHRIIDIYETKEAAVEAFRE